jgi:hypothetical protein
MLFASIDELKKHVPNTSSNLETLQPYLEAAEREYLIPLLGQAMYDEINTAYNGPDPLSPAQGKLLPYLQAPVANLAYYLGRGILNVNITDTGFLINDEEDRKAANAFHLDDIGRDFCRLGHKGLDHMLLFLETNAADYLTWKNSDYYTLSRKTFVYRLIDFNDIVFINNSRQTFVAMRPIMDRIQRKRLRTELGGTFFDAMLARHIANDYETGEIDLIADLVNPALVHLSVAAALKELSLEVTANGLQINSFEARIINKKDVSTQVSILNARREESELLGEAYLTDLKDYLNKNSNAEVFAAYFSSDKYTNPGETKTSNPSQGGFVVAL